jgi:hypothetical protein
MESTIRLFADNCIIYRKIINNEDMEKLQIYLNRLGGCGFENELIIDPSGSKTVFLMRAQVMEPVYHSLERTVILEVSSCKYLGIILYCILNWSDQVNCAMKILEGTSFCNAYP